MATAAITVVIKNPNNQHLEAYGEVIRDQSGGIAGVGLPDAPAVAIPAENNNPAANICDQIAQTYSMFYTHIKIPNGTSTRLHLQSIANDLVGLKFLHNKPTEVDIHVVKDKLLLDYLIHNLLLKVVLFSIRF